MPAVRGNNKIKFGRKMRYLIIFLAIIILSCQQDNSLDPTKFIPSSEDLKDKIDYEFVAENRVRLFANETASFVEPFFNKVTIGYRNRDEQFVLWDTINVYYTQENDKYLMTFSYERDLVWNDLSFPYDHAEIQIQCIISHLDFRTVLLKVYPHKYPYESADIYLRRADITEEPRRYSNFIDTQIDGLDTYCLTSPGGHILFRYQKYTREYEHILYTEAENFVFHEGIIYLSEMAWLPITRYNLKTQNFESFIADSLIDQELVLGMDIYDEIFYLFLQDKDSKLNRIDLYNLDAELIESIQVPFSGWGFCVYEDIAYIFDYQPDLPGRILRFNVKDKQVLTPLLAPSSDTYSIQILDDTLYYTLYWNWLVCYLPLSELREIQ